MALVDVDSPRPHVRQVTLNRPDRLNAMSIDLVIELFDALGWRRTTTAGWSC